MTLELFTKAKFYIQNLSVYFFAALIPMALSLVSNPFIAKNMSPQDYAIVGYYVAFNLLFTPLVNFYLLHYYTKRYYEIEEEERKILKANIFKSLIFISLIFSIIAMFIVYIYHIYLNSESQIPYFPYAILSMIAVPLSGIYTLNLTEYRMERQAKKFFKLSVSNGAIGVIVALLFVVVFKWGALGRISATLLSTALLFIFVLLKNRDVWGVKFDYGILKESMMFCLPLVLASMLTFFCSGYDKIYLERQGDLQILGIYSVGVSIANYLHVFSNSINDTFQPDIFESIVKRKFIRCFKFISLKIGIMSICVGLFILFAPYIIRVLTYGRYEASTPFAIIISLSTITSMLYYSFSQVTVALGYTTITLVNKIIGSILSVISFACFIPLYGAMGAAWGVVLSYLYFFIGNVLLVLYKYKFGKR